MINESVAQFALRVEGCLTNLQSEIHNSDTLKKDISGRIAMTDDLALFTFALGLQPRLSNNVRCRSPKSLNDAIIALEEEKIQNLLYKTVNKPNCKICGKIGHSDAECNAERRRTNPPRGFQNSQPSTSFNQSGSHAFCRYCKNKGHDITQCRKRKYNNERKNSHDNSNNYRKSANVNQITYEPQSPSPPSPTTYHIPRDNNDDSDFDLN